MLLYNARSTTLHLANYDVLCGMVDNLGSASIDSNTISSLPANFRAWKKLYWPQEGFGWQWELLRTFFASKGYTLYVHRGSRGLKPEIENDPPDDSFGLLGVRTNFWPIPFFMSNVRIYIILLQIYLESYSVNLQRAEVWGARDMRVP